MTDHMKEKPGTMDTPDFSGEYRITCVADEAAAAVGLVDKPCWRIEGPDGLKAFVWTWWREPRKILYEFFGGLDVFPGDIKPVVFAVRRLTATCRSAC